METFPRRVKVVRFELNHSYRSRRVSHKRSSMATEDAKCNWMATLDSALLALRSWVKVTCRSCWIFFSLLWKTPDIVHSFSVTQNDLVELAAILFGLPICRGDCRRSVIGEVTHSSRRPRLVSTSLSFFHENSCWSASKTLFAECPKWRWVPRKTAAPSLRSNKQCDGRRWKSRWVCSTSVTRRRAHCGMGEWDLYFFVPSAAFPLITSESQQILLWLWRSKQLFPCCSAAVGCEPCVELHYLSVNDATVRLSVQMPLHMDLGGSQMWLVWARESKSAGHELAQTR